MRASWPEEEPNDAGAIDEPPFVLVDAFDPMRAGSEGAPRT
jgi:hypothetical protein